MSEKSVVTEVGILGCGMVPRVQINISLISPRGFKGNAS